MKTKGIPFWEQHLEHIVLGVAVLVLIGFTAMQLNMVVGTNDTAVRLWQRMGFAIVGRIPAAFRHATLGPVDTYVMHRML